MTIANHFITLLNAASQLNNQTEGPAGQGSLAFAGQVQYSTVEAVPGYKGGTSEAWDYCKGGELMSRLVDLAGKKFGRLTVLQRAGKDSGRNATWLCRCECGNECVVVGYDLRSGHTKSCGCLHATQFAEIVTKHGGCYSRLYSVWKSMITRCTNPKSSVYKHYGGRGIKVCDEWRHNFATFQDWAIQTGYDETAPRGECTIDRIDVNGDYCPGNCRWATVKEQANNRRPRMKKK